jgi:hypothetical protein
MEGVIYSIKPVTLVAGGEADLKIFAPLRLPRRH